MSLQSSLDRLQTGTPNARADPGSVINPSPGQLGSFWTEPRFPNSGTEANPAVLSTTGHSLRNKGVFVAEWNRAQSAYCILRQMPWRWQIQIPQALLPSQRTQSCLLQVFISIESTKYICGSFSECMCKNYFWESKCERQVCSTGGRWRQKAPDFEVILGYILRLRPAWATQNPLKKTKTKTMRIILRCFWPIDITDNINKRSGCPACPVTLSDIVNMWHGASWFIPGRFRQEVTMSWGLYKVRVCSKGKRGRRSQERFNQ